MNIEEVKKLSDTEINIKIAKLQGWTYGICECDGAYCDKAKRWRDPHGYWTDVLDYDYCNDLNAMYEAEAILNTRVLKLDFCNELVQIIPYNESNPNIWDDIHSTARQRAEAFILTLTIDKSNLKYLHIPKIFQIRQDYKNT